MTRRGGPAVPHGSLVHRRTLRLAGSLIAAVTLVGLGIPGAEASVSQTAKPTITLSPASGGPGALVTIRGEVPGMTDAGHSQAFLTVCVNGCVRGFVEYSATATWTGPKTFVARLTIPRVPVLTALGPLVPEDGTYRIGVTCVSADIFGCLGRTEAKAKFKIVHAARPTRCSGGQPCARLTLSSSRLYPGQDLRVEGWAPVSEFPYDIVLSRGRDTAQVGVVEQSRSGYLKGTIRVPALATDLGVVNGGRYTVGLQYDFAGIAHRPRRGAAGMKFTISAKRLSSKLRTKVHVVYSETVSVGQRKLDVRSLLTWKTLASVHIQAVQQSQGLPYTVRSGAPSDFAYCVPGGIETTKDSGAHWHLIPTESAAKRSLTTSYPMAVNISTPFAAPLCQSITWDPSAQDTLYASFPAMSRGIGEAPPLYDVLYETRDFGASWTPVVAPNEYSGGDFGGIYVDRAAHDAVVALYTHSVVNAQIDGARGAGVTAIATTDGGARWHPFPIACPAIGPCLRFGGMPGGVPSMGTFNFQPLMRSGNHGRTWTTLSWPSGNAYQRVPRAGGGRFDRWQQRTLHRCRVPVSCASFA